jgi:hypothetical protein
MWCHDHMLIRYWKFGPINRVHACITETSPCQCMYLELIRKDYLLIAATRTGGSACPDRRMMLCINLCSSKPLYWGPGILFRPCCSIEHLRICKTAFDKEENKMQICVFRYSSLYWRYQDSCLQGQQSLYICRWLLTLQSKLLPLILPCKKALYLGNVGPHLPNHTASHPGTPLSWYHYCEPIRIHI